MMVIWLYQIYHIYNPCHTINEYTHHTTRTCTHTTYIHIYTSGADLGFSERGANHSRGSLKQGVWGAQHYRIFCFQKCHLIQDLEYLIQILKFCEKELTKVVPGCVVGATLWKV